DDQIPHQRQVRNHRPALDKQLLLDARVDNRRNGRRLQLATELSRSVDCFFDRLGACLQSVMLPGALLWNEMERFQLPDIGDPQQAVAGSDGMIEEGERAVLGE